MSAFQIQVSHIEPDRRATPSVDEHTRARLEILLGSTNLTEFETLEFHEHSDHIEIPTYYLAEWLAENWWAVLNEPRKSEDEQDGFGEAEDYPSRHSFITAQQGFALPAISIVPNGRAIQVLCHSRVVPFADVRFLRSASLMMRTSDVEATLRGFIAQAVESLQSAGIEETDLQVAWEAVTRTNEDEVPYCRMVGALGLSPYTEHPSIDRWLFDVAEQAGEDLAYDLCLVARPDTLEDHARSAIQAAAASLDATPADISSLLQIQLPSDSFVTPAWKRGVQTAKLVRERLHIADDDPKGGSKFFESIGMGVEGAISETEMETEARAPIVGAVTRDAEEVRVGMLQRTKAQRRFAAARGIFVAWNSNAKCGRLLTKAVTRDQQSSRAFAAEMLAPVSFLRRQAYKGKLQNDQVYDLAYELNVAPDVVWKQAMNNGMNLTVY